jgi:hypothetical protein
MQYCCCRHDSRTWYQFSRNLEAAVGCFKEIYQQLCWGLQQRQQLSPKLAAAAIDTVLLVDSYGISCALLLVSIVAALQPVAAVLYTLSKNREIEGPEIVCISKDFNIEQTTY